VGVAISGADERSPQGRAFKTGEPQFCPDLAEADGYDPPPFYREHGIVSTVDVIVAAKDGPAFGILEVDSKDVGRFDRHDIDFLTGFANVLAEAVATMERAEVLRTTLLRMERLVEEREVLSLELRHRVRNSLHLVYGLLTAELRNSHDERSLVAFRSIATRVISLAEVFEHLLGTGMTRIIDFGQYVEALCTALPDLYQNRNIEIRCLVEPVQLELDAATSMGIVITELVSNAYLHAFPSGSGEITVALHATLDRVVLSVADNGSGFVEQETKRHGVGLVRRLVERVGGNLILQSKGGSKWTVDLPMDELVP
jgi:two-component sensor histidine kinase